jgi:hypothetical protein
MIRRFVLSLCLCMSASIALADDSTPEKIRVAPITSAAQLEAYLQVPGRSPLDALSPRSRQRFIESLTFSSSGLSTYRYSDIERELTPREAYALVSLFGVQESLATLHFHKTDDVRAVD